MRWLCVTLTQLFPPTQFLLLIVTVWNECVQSLLVMKSKAVKVRYFLSTFCLTVFLHVFLPSADWDPLRAPEVPDIRGWTPALWLLSQSKIFALYRHSTNTRRPTDYQAWLTCPLTNSHSASRVWSKDLITHDHTHTCACYIIIHSPSYSTASA